MPFKHKTNCLEQNEMNKASQTKSLNCILAMKALTYRLQQNKKEKVQTKRTTTNECLEENEQQKIKQTPFKRYKTR